MSSQRVMLVSTFCFPGSEDGKIHVWNAESGMKVALLDGKHTGPVTCLQFNPKFMTFASACSNMVRVNHKVEINLIYLFQSRWNMCTPNTLPSLITGETYNILTFL